MALKTTGYQAAAQTVAWTSGQSLDSATDNEWTDLSDEIDNTVNQYVMVDIEVVLGSAAFTGVDSIVDIYIVRSVDGTNFSDWTGNVTTDQQQNDSNWVAAVKTSGTTAGQRLTAPNISVPPGKYKYGFRNKTGVTTAGTGNTVSWRPHSYKDE